MKKYRFPLERLERVREAQLSQARADLAAANAQVAAAEAARRRALEQLSATSEVPGGRLSPEDFPGWLASRRAAHQGLVVAGEALELARDVREGALGVWQERRQDHEVLTRLDGRRREQWLVEVRRDEALQLDEFASQRHGRDGLLGP